MLNINIDGRFARKANLRGGKHSIFPTGAILLASGILPNLIDAYFGKWHINAQF